jgi:TRAP-type uncharacterized transport system substrate-binding protein
MPDAIIRDQAFTQAESLLGRLRRFYSNHHIQILFGLIGLSLLLSAYWFYQARSRRNVILYTGSIDSDSYRRGMEIRKHFETHPASWFVDYDIEVRQSAGLPENRQFVTDAKVGEIVLGFDQDGFSPPPNVRTLFPMTDVTLHVLIKRTPESGTVPYQPVEEIQTLQQLIDLRRRTDGHKHLRFFLGPKGSGTRLLAETVLQRYSVKIPEVSAGEQLSWPAAYEALRRGELDVIFDSSEVGSPSMADKARENSFRLISLDHVKGIVQGQQSLLHKEIQPGAYTVDGRFSNKLTETVSTQRIIICSESLKEFDAYYLTLGIQETFRNAVPIVPWDKKPIIPGAGLIVPLHPGATQVRDKSSEPLVIFQNFLYSNLQWILTILGGFLSWRISRRTKNRAPIVAIQHTESTYPQGTKIGPIKFGVADVESDPEKLKVDWKADNERLFPKSCGTLVHNGHACSLELSPPPGETGRSTITIIVTDEQGAEVQSQFLLNVVAIEKLVEAAQAEPTVPESKTFPRPLRDAFVDLDDLLKRLGETALPALPKVVQAFRRELDEFKVQVQKLTQVYAIEYEDVLSDITRGLGKLELEFDRLKTSSKPAKPTEPAKTS